MPCLNEFHAAKIILFFKRTNTPTAPKSIKGETFVNETFLGHGTTGLRDCETSGRSDYDC